MHKLISRILLIGWAGGGALLAQFPTDVVKATLTADREVARPGEQVLVTADIEVLEGWHLYATNLTGFGPIPTHIEWADTILISAMGPYIEPDPVVSWDENFKKEVGWHSGAVRIGQAVQISPDQPPGPAILKGDFVFMACTETMCLIPYYQAFEIALTIEEGPVRPSFAYIQVAATDNERAITGLEGTELQRAISDGFFPFIMLSFAMGLLALLTPCVFPMIPITVSFFLKQGESGQIKPLKAAGLYAGGIVVIYSALGMLLALTLGAAGANQVAANPWINLILAALFVFFALSLFGMYEIQLPAKFRQFTVNQESRGGMLGIFFMALTFTITSFTCTVQFVGLLLVAASQGHYLWPAIGMVAYAMTFAAPFFLLALFPQYIANMPRSGSWLNSVKVVMGFLELGAAFKFISNSDLVWSWGFFDHQLVLASWIIIALLTGLYILGKVRLPHDSVLEAISVPRLLLSSTFLVFALLLAPGLFGQRIPGLVEAYLPPRLEEGRGGIALGGELSRLKWHLEYESALADAQSSNRPIFLDVTGYTCTNCRWMEANIFTKPVITALFEQFVLLRLYTDGGENFRQKQKFVIERFGTAALPLYVVMTPMGGEIARFPGMSRSEKVFADFLGKGLAL